MPLPKNNLYPDFNISRLSHIELGVKDLEASFAFYVETLGLQVTEKESDYILSLIHISEPTRPY